ncbi:unnamed protein product [Rhizophagus irregularis]|nr:unnamed protein product [Rhizophagus irregularis]
MNEEVQHTLPDNPTPTQAILRLYKPCKTYPLTISTKILSPYTSCDTRGSGTLYNTKKGRYFLLSLSNTIEQPLSINDRLSVYTNDIELRNHSSHTYQSTSIKPNFKYLLGIYLTFVFSLNRQFPKHIIDKYFSRLRQLLQEKYMALRNRLTSELLNNKRTTTYIRFSSGDHVIYLGFFFSCGTYVKSEKNHCVLPAAYVLSKKRWRCGEHIAKLPSTQSRSGIRRDPRFYKDQIHRILTLNAKKEKKNVKQVHSNRLGVSYTVSINKYHRGLGRDNQDLKHEMESGIGTKDNYATKTRNLNETSTRPYFKEYRSLRFDIVRSPQQIARWNRLTCSVIRANHHSPFPQPKIIHTPTTQNPNPVVFKQLRHLPSKNIPFRYGNYIKAGSIEEKKHKVREKTVRKRFDVSSIPQYNYGYGKALLLHNLRKHVSPVMIDTIPADKMTDVTYVISNKDRHIINDPSVFLRRTPPPEHDSITTVSDRSYVSAVDEVETVIYPLTPAHDQE